MVLRVPLPGGRSISFNQDTGVLRINLAAPSETNVSVPPLGTEPLEQVRTSIEVKDTGTAKGFGAFCRLDCGSTRSGSETEVVGIPSGSFLGFYSGEVVTTREELDAKIAKRRSFGEEDTARNAMDYVMSLDGGLTFIDGYERAQDKSEFAPVHLNHADKGTPGCNIIRLLEDDRVAFFTLRDIIPGEEMCFNYGANFWKGREGDKI